VTAIVVALAIGCSGGAAPATAEAPADGAIAARVVRVVDGDTIDVRIGNREESVRFLGVDAPERGRDGKPSEPLYREATTFVERALEGGAVRLLADPLGDDRDRYDRILRYVVLPDGSTLNEALIREGLGAVMTEWPYGRMEAFVAAERDARASGRGMWSNERVRRVEWEDAPLHEGAVVDVSGTIVASRCLKAICFLNFDEDYRAHAAAVILDSDRHRFDGDPSLVYRGRRVRVVGRVTYFRDRPQIVLHAPDQITLLD
jgi:endonuclease YncB( thermonuclease family)